jgi:transcriptional regulator with XRE-family HTH domain
MSDFRELLKETLVPVTSLARATGLSRQFIYDLMHGRRTASSVTLAKIAKALRVTERRLKQALTQ